MENATLFCVGSVRGIRTGAIACIDGSPFHWDEGDYDPHGTVVAEGKKNMIITGLRVAKKIVAENETSPNATLSQKSTTHKTEASQIFPEADAQNYLKAFKELNMCQYLSTVSSMNEDKISKIMSLTLNGVFSDLQFYLENGTEMSEEEIKTLIIMFYKVQKGLDKEFTEKMASFAKSDKTTPTN